MSKTITANQDTVQSTNKQTGEKLFIADLNTFLPVSPSCLETLQSLALSAKSVVSFQSGNNHLFENYPALRDHISYVTLGTFPTPIKKLEHLSKKFDVSLYVKQDNISGKQDSDGTCFFGGNKVRKLEFLLADACAQGAKSVLTFGCVGSNHVVATACYANMLGMQPIALLKPQPNSHVVQRNLLLMRYYGAELHGCPNDECCSLQAISACLERKSMYGDFPYIIPTGGSVPLGILGFVNAIFELKQQIQLGIAPEPDYIYVAAGSLGTTVGLLLGIKATGLKTKLMPVGSMSISDLALYIKSMGSRTKHILLGSAPISDLTLVKNYIISLFQETNQLLIDNDPSFSRFDITEDEINIVEHFSGDDYGLFTPEAQSACKLLFETEGVALDGTYTGKTFAALLDSLVTKKHKNQVILFWDTFCDNQYDDLITFQDYKKLPVVFHAYFKEKVQDLDI
ncbi:MAG: pyridoxal-phosphate dependent enzyme [bacterium]|nr:pyridoxal-phosphate dependent enzyme [bacterium]